MTDIRIIGDIDTDSYKGFTYKLSKLEKTNPTVTIELSSGGGDAYSAMAFYDRMRSSPSSLHVLGTGLVASAAVLILAAGDKRSMTPSSWLMMHEDTMDGLEELNVTQLEEYARHSRRLEDQWARLLQQAVPIGLSKWSRLHKTETYIDAQTCLSLGIIHEITKRTKK